MSETISAEPPTPHSDVPAGRPACPVCGRESGEGLAPFGHLPDELKRLVTANAPGGREVDAVCPRCVQLFQRAQRQ
nr:hypothetical protein [Acidobacteriota bacterium]